MTTTLDLIPADKALDMLTILSVLTTGYYTSTVLAEEAGLDEPRTYAALRSLVAYGKAKYKPLEGYAKS
jgi:hypothetical protein